jgi:enoyl-[acyl-carrier-protein] reductase (NADH)
MGLLEGKLGIVFGVANKRSIAWAIAQAWAREGAKLAFTYQGEACLGFLQACPAHPYLMHHHQIENCCHG